MSTIGSEAASNHTTSALGITRCRIPLVELALPRLRSAQHGLLALTAKQSTCARAEVDHRAPSGIWFAPVHAGERAHSTACQSRQAVPSASPIPPGPPRSLPHASVHSPPVPSAPRPTILRVCGDAMAEGILRESLGHLLVGRSAEPTPLQAGCCFRQQQAERSEYVLPPADPRVRLHPR